MSRLLVDLDPLESEERSVRIPTRNLTREQYDAFCAANRDMRTERSASGEIVVQLPVSWRTSLRNGEVTMQLGAWQEADGRGVAFGPDAGFDLPNGANRSPDASWMVRWRIAALSEEERDGFLPLCPDFVVELRSRSDRLETLAAKMQEYIENGARLGWLIDPHARTVHVYRPGAPAKVLDDPDSVAGDPELPGFRLQMRRVWKSW